MEVPISETTVKILEKVLELDQAGRIAWDFEEHVGHFSDMTLEISLASLGALPEQFGITLKAPDGLEFYWYITGGTEPEAAYQFAQQLRDRYAIGWDAHRMRREEQQQNAPGLESMLYERIADL